MHREDKFCTPASSRQVLLWKGHAFLGMKHRFGEIWDVAQNLAGGKGGWREVLDPAAQARPTARVQPAARPSMRSQTAHVHTHVHTTCEHSQPRRWTRAHRTRTLRAPVGSSWSFSWGVGQRSTSGNLYTSLEEHIYLPPAAGHKLPLPSSCPRVPEPSLGHPWEGPGRDVPSSESLICVHNCFCASVLLCATLCLWSWASDGHHGPAHGSYCPSSTCNCIKSKAR